MPRTRRNLKWVGLVLSILLSAAWVGTAVCYVVYSTTTTRIGLAYGTFGWLDSPPTLPQAGWQFGWEASGLWLDYGLLPKRSTIGGQGFQVFIPLWIPLLIVAVPTAILWCRDRRHPPGHCRCGYNLTGNVSGRCPECGIAVRKPLRGGVGGDLYEGEVG